MGTKAQHKRECPPECGSKCCTYFSLEIDTPTGKTDFDNIRWYLLHEKVAVYLVEKCWHLLVLNPCSALDPLGRCVRYHDRPHLCREYGKDTCEFHEHVEFDAFFETPEDLDAYLEKKRLRRKKPAPSLRRFSR